MDSHLNGEDGVYINVEGVEGIGEVWGDL